MRKYLFSAVAVSAVVAGTTSYADEAAAKKWIDEEFQPSTLSKSEQLSEMNWFIERSGSVFGHGNQCSVRRHSNAWL